MKIEQVHLGAVAVLKPEEFPDERGVFYEEFRADKFKNLGLPYQFYQENHSISSKGVLRGLHFQFDPQMGKLMRVLSGEAFLVAVDIRKNSPTMGEWFGIQVSAKDRKQIWAPPGFARGFCVLSDIAEIQYLCTGIYNHAGESGIHWNDPEINIKWPVKAPLLSEKDSQAQSFSQWQSRKESKYFQYILEDNIIIE